MKFKTWSICDIGLERQSNEDSIYINEDLGLFIVADGMGGHQGGQVASQIAVEVIPEYIKNHLNKVSSPVELLEKAFKKANQTIYEVGCYENPELMGMGTTAVVCFFLGQQFYVANVGDSRAYLFKKPCLWQLTNDHSLLFEQIRNHVISERQSHLVTGKSILTRGLGVETYLEVDVFIREIKEGESVMLCSDGLCGQVSNPEILKAMDKAGDHEKIIPHLFTLVKEQGCFDNISIILIEIDPKL